MNFYAFGSSVTFVYCATQLAIDYTKKVPAPPRKVDERLMLDTMKAISVEMRWGLLWRCRCGELYAGVYETCAAKTCGRPRMAAPPEDA